MRYPKMITGLVAAGLLVTGCGGSDDGGGERDGGKKDSAAKADRTPGSDDEPKADTGAGQEELPVKVTGPDQDVVKAEDEDPEPPGKPESGADFTAQVEYKLRESVLRAAGADGETSATCPDGVTQKAGATSKCTATYEGAEIPYEVTISDKYEEGDFLTMYNAKPQKGLLVAKAVHHELWTTWGEGREAEKLACEELPVAKAVDLDADTGYVCQAWTEYGGPDRDGGYETLKVVMGNYGPKFEAVDA
ncbi:MULTISPECIES: DUF4333 domain-containing protein [unclassified Streptomyces]|uniref:DUF4333 domain-containing protein n=1 Tax=unclassified Streptomyces TaxID=2593676 RepID=UPI0022B6ADDF|nr:MULTISPECIES: DUF4333 domain-containing protein [unclassified Streptomyces]MCZ7417020.1 DUF4333 domain-containing protein [Streptomyces sp. WMMC897]MCZ7433152.1 DUF4333 domain-containing protein [Streptomyces sp. WMMC1477]